jgi:hypothetical protein
MIQKSPILLSMLVSMLSFAPISVAQDSTQDSSSILFGEPVRIMAGDAFLGAKRLYPSPVLHDVNADGKLDVVIGDLWGKITFAQRNGEKENVTFDREKPLLASNGKQLDFSSW